MIKKTNLEGLVFVKNKSYKDKRGYFKELLIEKKLKKKISFFSNVFF